MGKSPTKLHPSELYKLKVLEGVSLAAIGDALEACDVRTLAAGEKLLAAGQPNRVMYMILSGRLGVHLDGHPSSEPVAYVEAGETVGELSVLDARPASAHVVAVETTRLAAVDEDVFWSLVDASHEFAVNLLLLLAQRLRTNNSTVAHSIRMQREYKRNAMVDALTGLYNRRWLDEALARFVNRYSRTGEALSLLVIDVDHFKRFNDEHGHAAGDAVLAAVARTLVGGVRPTDLVARFGGEEFVVILPDADREAARAVAERLREAVRVADVIGPDGQPLPNVTISVGGTSLDACEPSASALFAAADAALYASKENGRNRVTF